MTDALLKGARKSPRSGIVEILEENVPVETFPYSFGGKCEKFKVENSSSLENSLQKKTSSG